MWFLVDGETSFVGGGYGSLTLRGSSAVAVPVEGGRGFVLWGGRAWV